MKLKKIIAGIAAAAVAASAMAISAFAAVFETTNAADGAPDPNFFYVPADPSVDYSKVAKIEAVLNVDNYVNGTIGVSANGTWTTPGTLEATGAATWTLDGLSGIDAADDAGNPKADAIQIQFWWLNAGTLTLDSGKVFDADGNVIQEISDAVAPPAGDENPPADEAKEDDAATDDAADTSDEADDDDAADVTDEDDGADDYDDDDETDDYDYDDDADDADDADDSSDNAAPADGNNAADAGTTSAPATGNVAVASIAAVMAVAGAAALVSRKRK